MKLNRHRETADGQQQIASVSIPEDYISLAMKLIRCILIEGQGTTEGPGLSFMNRMPTNQSLQWGPNSTREKKKSKGCKAQSRPNHLGGSCILVAGQGTAEGPGLPLRAGGSLMQGCQPVMHGGQGAEG